MRFLKCLFVGFFFLVLVSSPCGAESIVLRGNAFKEPKVWMENGLPRGILVDIMESTQKELGVDYRYDFGPWARSYNMALKGQGGIMGISKTEERLALFDFSEPIFYDRVILVVKRGHEFAFDSLNDLQGKRMGSCRGCSFGPEYEHVKTYFTLDTDANNIQRLKKLMAGRIDAAIFSPGVSALNRAIDSDPSLKREMFTVLEKPLVQDPNYVAFSKDLHMQPYLESLNAVIRKKYQSGAIQSIIDKY